MPEVVACRACDRRLRIDDRLVGQAVRCPACGACFTAGEGAACGNESPHVRPASTPAAPRTSSPASWDGPARIAFLTAMIDKGTPFVPADAGGWRRVRLGLTLMLFFCGSPLLVILAPCLAGALMASGIHGPSRFWGTVLPYLGVPCPFLLALAGLIVCATAPRLRNARGLGLSSLLLYVGTVGSLAALVFIPRFLAPHDKCFLQSGLGLLTTLLALGFAVIFCLFLRSVLATVDAGRPLRGVTCLAVLMIAVACFFAVFASSGFVHQAFGPGRWVHRLDRALNPAACILATVVGVGLLVWLVGYIVQVRAAIAAHLSDR
jgi:hypothetical protein